MTGIRGRKMHRQLFMRQAGRKEKQLKQNSTTMPYNPRKSIYRSTLWFIETADCFGRWLAKPLSCCVIQIVRGERLSLGKLNSLMILVNFAD